MEIVLLALLALVLALAVLNVYLTNRWRSDSLAKQDESREFLGEQEVALHDLGQALERQETSVTNLRLNIQTFQEPLSKLNRYLSGGTLAGTVGEWSLEAILGDILPANMYRQNVEIIPNTGHRVEFAIELPEGWLPIDAKFPSALYDNYVEAADAGDTDRVKSAKNAIKRRVISDAADIKEKSNLLNNIGK